MYSLSYSHSNVLLQPRNVVISRYLNISSEISESEVLFVLLGALVCLSRWPQLPGGWGSRLIAKFQRAQGHENHLQLSLQTTYKSPPILHNIHLIVQYISSLVNIQRFIQRKVSSWTLLVAAWGQTPNSLKISSPLYGLSFSSSRLIITLIISFVPCSQNKRVKKSFKSRKW